MVTVPDSLLAAVVEKPVPLIAGHVTPDADCLGAMLALATGIQQVTGQKPYCVLPSGTVSNRMRYLCDLAQPLLLDNPQPCEKISSVVICDTAQEKRANLPDFLKQGLRAGRRVINIDHHASNTQYGEMNWVDPQASSTSEMIYRIFKAARWPISTTVASLLYAGIHADTVGFSLPNASPEALAAAAELVACGAKVGEIGEKLGRSQTQSEFDLRRIIYDNTRLTPSGKIAYSAATYEEIRRAGCQAADIDDQVEIPRSLNGAQIAILLTEGNPGKIRVNFRSKSSISVLPLAQQLGGGGHNGAAGVIMNGTIPQALAMLLPVVEKYLVEAVAPHHATPRSSLC